LHEELQQHARSWGASPAEIAAQCPDLSASDCEIIAAAHPFSMTGIPRLASLLIVVDYLISNRIPGAFVECGVWKGGSVVAMTRTLLRAGERTRPIFLYDTFEGMSQPSPVDVSYTGERAEELYRETMRPGGGSQWCAATIDAVRSVVLAQGYPADRIHFVKGRVEETIPSTIPDEIALLRLDTDWYESTRHELRHLYPLLVPGGVLIVDDYGYWKGARKAVDEFFEQTPDPVLISRIDAGARLVVKPIRSRSSAAAPARPRRSRLD
jgi:hypothetical protein